MIYLTIREVIELHRMVVAQSGGSLGIRDHGALASSIGQPQQAFDGSDLYVTVVDKAAALAFFLTSNHPFIDGNKRVAHASLEVVLLLNGLELSAPVDEQESVMLRLAAGELTREAFTEWVSTHVHARGA